MSIVIVSNRVARAEPNQPMMGGLAAALLPAVKSYGAVWVGSSGKLQKATTPHDSFAQVEAFGKGAIATVDLPEQHYAAYYEGFANSALWPLLHSRADLMHFSDTDYNSYREVNAYMARALLRFCKPEARYWVQDYHFLPLGLELRKLGVQQEIGFFLHTPWPTRAMISSLPQHRELIKAMLAYDLIGFQTDRDRENFANYLEQELRAVRTGGGYRTPYGVCRLGTFPIGVDADVFAENAKASAQSTEIDCLRRSLEGKKLVIGVDRVDYSKGLTHRFRAFDHLLQNNPSLKRKVSMLQIAVPSRSNINTYKKLQDELASMVGEFNGRHGEIDWTPIRYLNKGFCQSTLAGFYRTAAVGLVTPLHDGMNLVAKEYVAAQDPENPGVLVLSKFAGAAEEMDSALLVNPHDIVETSRQLAKALDMPLSERIARWEPMMEKLRTSSIHAWFAGFLAQLKSADGDTSLVPAQVSYLRTPAKSKTAVSAATAPATQSIH